jgi:hypothetical protein
MNFVVKLVLQKMMRIISSYVTKSMCVVHMSCVGVSDCSGEMSRSQDELNTQQEIEHSIHYT